MLFCNWYEETQKIYLTHLVLSIRVAQKAALFCFLPNLYIPIQISTDSYKIKVYKYKNSLITAITF